MLRVDRHDAARNTVPACLEGLHEVGAPGDLERIGRDAAVGALLGVERDAGRSIGLA